MYQDEDEATEGNPDYENGEESSSTSTLPGRFYSRGAGAQPQQLDPPSALTGKSTPSLVLSAEALAAAKVQKNVGKKIHMPIAGFMARVLPPGKRAADVVDPETGEATAYGQEVLNEANELRAHAVVEAKKHATERDRAVQPQGSQVRK